jgi:hypothetical protein
VCKNAPPLFIGSIDVPLTASNDHKSSKLHNHLHAFRSNIRALARLSSVFVALISGLTSGSLSWCAPTSNEASMSGQPSSSVFVSEATATGALTSPTAGSILGASTTFTWSAGTGASEYKLDLGTTGIGSSDLYAGDATTSTSATVTGIPFNGVTVYATLSSYIDGAWQSVQYTYTEAQSPVLSTPTPSSHLSSSTVTFAWTAGSGVSEYLINVGTEWAGAGDIYGSGQIRATSASVSGLPTNGVTVYVMLKYEISGVWYASYYTYTAADGLSSLSCASSSETGAATDNCTVTLSTAAPTGGQSVSVASSTTAVTVPTTVTVATGSTSANFQAEVSTVSSAQTVTLTATSGGTAQSYSISLEAAVPTLKLSASSVSFGTVNVASTATQSLTLTSTGTGILTVSAGSVSGTGFTLSGASFPLTLSAGQSTALTIGFDPTVAGATSGTLTLTSNSSTGSTSTVALSGTGAAVPYKVSLTWNAAVDSSDPVAGYDVYRATSGSSSYTLLNSSLDTSTSYTDATVVDGSSYTYYIVSVDAEGNQSAPSSTFAISIP